MCTIFLLCTYVSSEPVNGGQNKTRHAFHRSAFAICENSAACIIETQLRNDGEVFHFCITGKGYRENTFCARDQWGDLSVVEVICTQRKSECFYRVVVEVNGMAFPA